MAMTVDSPRVPRVVSIAELLADGTQLSIVAPGREPVALPPELRDALVAAAQVLEGGGEVLVTGKDRYVTTQEAAEFLGVSRPTMIRILDLGELRYDRPNKHRRIKLSDLTVYKAERAKRRAALDELLAMSDEMDQYDGGFVRTR
ncbi:MAG: excisionase family DNA-binding protein [Bifidobacteriaceae bacterium]|jgi:excisionase family DNA binding protein|nr:excisionase family DNA-binding protein [Bifidobacteriaceae bacterium]